MAKAWHAVVDNSTNLAISFVSSDGTAPTQQELDSINARLIPLSQEPRWGQEVWDSVKLAMIGYSAPLPDAVRDRVADIMTDPGLPASLLASLEPVNAGNRTALRTVLERHLPDEARYYT